MAPDYQGTYQGTKLPKDGTACGDECRVCGDRYTIRYYTGDGRGPYCSAHIPPMPIRR